MHPTAVYKYVHMYRVFVHEYSKGISEARDCLGGFVCCSTEGWMVF